MSSILPNHLQKNMDISAGLCDTTSRLSPISAFTIFQDIAAEHSNMLGAGSLDLTEKENALWIIMRIKIRYHHFPMLNSKISVKTWPAPPQGMRSNRYYSIGCNGSEAISAISEWAIIDTDSRKFRLIESTSFPTDLDFLPEKSIIEPFRRFKKESFTDDHFVYSLTVRSTMTDRAHHTNNVWYCHFLLDSFSVSELEEMTIHEIEISYLHETHEGEKLEIFRKKIDEGWLFAIKKEDGSNAIMACIATS